MLTAEDIYKVLSKQRFADFYGKVDENDDSPFTKHLVMDENAPSKAVILQKIRELFNAK